MWKFILDQMLSTVFLHGALDVHYPDGTFKSYGDGSGQKVTVRVTDPAMVGKIARNPELYAGEAYMDGSLTVDNDDLYGLLKLGIINVFSNPGPWWKQWIDKGLFWLGRVNQRNPIGRARQNVSHHYDLSADLYDLFLDADRQYSCAYFADPAMTLEEAQFAKKHHIAKKLRITPGMRILDIGCGWGGLGITLARDYGAHVVGVTLSEEQHKIAVQRAKDAGVADRCDFRLMDYRHVEESFDRIVSVGMFEHVGVPHYREYFAHVNQKLKKDGVALVHTIGRCGPPDFTSPWITKYIFPGGYVPSMSEMIQAVEKERLFQTDIEIWRMHYADTLREWYNRFMANIDTARDLYDERFCRMWRYYLIACEVTFRYGRQTVFQVQLTHDQQAVPLTRDYMYDGQRPVELQAAE
ncbi:MAG: cyclopropane-fatty-acyl-phospholipid synthase family protein [Pseudomonadota bacterium]